MTPKPRTLGELWDAGEAPRGARQLTDRERLELADRSEHQLAAVPWGSIRTASRKRGRPARGVTVEATSLRSLRWENSLWDLLGLEAEVEQISVNRMVKELVVEGLSLRAGQRLGPKLEMPGQIIHFNPSARQAGITYISVDTPQHGAAVV